METIDGSAMVICGGDSDDPCAVRDAIVAEAERLAGVGISEEEFRRMLRSFMGRRVRDLDSFEATCFRVCAYHYEGVDYFRFPESFETVSREELNAFWRENIRSDRCAMAIVEPRRGKES